jgi:hypothetical protein
MHNIKILILVFFVALFLISNHLMDVYRVIDDNEGVAINGFWTVYEPVRAYHLCWYLSYFSFFVVVTICILKKGG